jgi:hypothetical protein
MMQISANVVLANQGLKGYVPTRRNNLRLELTRLA